MLYCFLSFVLGLVVGWNFFPQPAFVKDLMDKFLSLFKN
jgi:hypothetical protein